MSFATQSNTTARMKLMKNNFQKNLLNLPFKRIPSDKKRILATIENVISIMTSMDMVHLTH
jgi:hypothetical protein